MADAVFHAEFTPNGGRGGVDSSGRIIVGPRGGNATTYAYVQNRFTVFDPATASADTYEVSLPVVWNESGYGCAWDGGVAMSASSAGSSTSAATYVVVAYADGTYTVLDPGVSWGADAYCVNLGSTLFLIRSGTGGTRNRPRVYNPATLAWADAGSTSRIAGAAPVLSGGTVWYVSSPNILGINPTTGAVVTTYSSVDSSGSTYMRPAELLGGRYWWSPGSGLLRGLRLSDGDIVTISVSGFGGAFCVDPDGYFWFTSSTAGFRIDPATGDIITHTHPTTIGTAVQLFASGGKVWAPMSDPTS